jgi:branched-chain amino acid transport system ATP-binding protein
VSLLAVERLDVRHGLLQAVREVSLQVSAGETLALVGANGAGKTTLLRAVAGAHKPAGGRVLFDGADVTMEPAYRRVRMGISLVPEGRRLFAELTVEENLLVGGRGGRSGTWNLGAVYELFPLLRARAKKRARVLSGGEQQMCAIGRGLMANPRVLMLDEVSLGLAPAVVQALYETIASIGSRGTTVVLVEQDVARALATATRVACLLEGRVVLEGDASTLSREQIVEAYFGLRRAATNGRAEP